MSDSILPILEPLTKYFLAASSNPSNPLTPLPSSGTPTNIAQLYYSCACYNENNSSSSSDISYQFMSALKQVALTLKDIDPSTKQDTISGYLRQQLRPIKNRVFEGNDKILKDAGEIKDLDHLSTDETKLLEKITNLFAEKQKPGRIFGTNSYFPFYIKEELVGTNSYSSLEYDNKKENTYIVEKEFVDCEFVILSVQHKGVISMVDIEE